MDIYLLVYVDMDDPDWCHHAECATKESECKLLHLEMRKILILIKIETQRMSELTNRLYEAANRIVLHAVETNNVPLFERYIYLSCQESRLIQIFNQTSGNTILHLAVEKGNVKIVKLLLQRMYCA